MNKKQADRASKRGGGDLASIILNYMRDNPRAQYQEMLNALHEQGVRINRHGSTKLLCYWEDARKKAAR